MLYAIVGILVIILDQGVKYWVTTNLMVGTVTEPLIPGILSLVRLHNDGAAFSFLAGGGARIYFIILTAVFTVAVIIALATNFINGRFGRWCLVLVTAGGLSNCLDRVLYGYVVDMFKIDLFDFAVFNVADIFITVFALLFIVYIIFGGESKSEKEDEFDEDDDEDADREPLNVSFKKNRAAERSAAPAKPARERAADAKAKKYRTDDDEDDEVASPRFGFGKRKKNTDEAVSKPAAKQPAKARAAVDNSPAARREKALEGFGRDAASSAQSRSAAKQGARKTRYEEDYEAYTAAHPEAKTAAQRKGAAAAASAPAFDPADPFAEWERANARVESRQNSGATAKAMGVNTQSAPKTAARETVEPAAAQTPARPAAPAAAPKTAPKSSSTDEFDLDDILNEFK